MSSPQGSPLPALTKWIKNCFKLVYVGVREFVIDDGPGRANALAYSSLLSLIPLIVVVLSILGGLQDAQLEHDRVVTFLYDRVLWPEEPAYLVKAVTVPEGALAPKVGIILTQKELNYWRQQLNEVELVVELQPSRRDELVGGLTDLVASLRSNLKTIGIIGALFLLVTTISLFNAIEAAANASWLVRRRRNPVRKFLVLWAFLTLGPILLAASFVIRAKIDAGAELNRNIDNVVIPYLFTWGAFFCLNKFVPNARVSTMGAAVSALVVGIVWEALKLFFSHYVVTLFSSESRTFLTYGSLALIPIFLFWLYLSWFLALLGMKLCYVWQHLGTYRGKRWAAMPLTTAAQELMAARLVAEIVAMQYVKGGGLDVRELAVRMHAPQHLLESAVDHLSLAGILLEDAENGKLVVATPPDHLDLDRVTAAVRGGGSAADVYIDDVLGMRIAEKLVAIEALRKQTLGSTTFAQIHREAHPQPSNIPLQE